MKTGILFSVSPNRRMRFHLLFHVIANQLPTSEEHFTIVLIENAPLREKNHIVTRPWSTQFTCDGTHPSFSCISPNRIAVLFPGNKSNTTRKVVLLSPLIQKRDATAAASSTRGE